MARKSKFDKTKILLNFSELNKQLSRATQDDIEDLECCLNTELLEGKRVTFVNRIHARLTRLKARRERDKMYHQLQVGEDSG